MKQHRYFKMPSQFLKFLGLILTITLGSCNQEWPNLLNTEYPPQTGGTIGKKNKVLIIAVDGISGTALSTISAQSVPTLSQMKKNALYSLRSLADFKVPSISYETAYANLLTGVTADKHNYFGDPEDSNLQTYPSFIKRVKSANPDKKVAVFGSNQDLLSPFIADADHNVFEGDDQTVVTKASEYIETSEADITAVFLNNPEQIGHAVQYNVANQSYKDAITAFDADVKKIKESLESRVNYNLENWLIIVTSTKGGTVTNSAALNNEYEDLNKNTFALYYNKNFNSVPVATPNTSRAPFSGYSPVYNGSLANNNTALIPDDNGLYNFGTDDFTLRFTMKGSGVERTWPVFLSKAGRIDNSNPGWRLYISRKLLSMQVGGAGSWENWGTNLVVNDGNWHNVVVVFFNEGGRRKVKVFVDGVKSTDVRDITGRGTVTTTEPLRIGRNRDDAELPDIQVSHLQIYRHAWSDADILDNSCKVEVNSSSIHYNKLVGYWPSDEGSSNRLVNKAPGAAGKDFILQGQYSWKSFSDVTAVLCPSIKDSFYKIVPNSVDLPYTIYSWLGIPISSTWGLEGKVWPFTFNNIRP